MLHSFFHLCTLRFEVLHFRFEAAHLDQYTGKTLVDVGYADYGIAGQATEWGISLACSTNW